MNSMKGKATTIKNFPPDDDSDPDEDSIDSEQTGPEMQQLRKPYDTQNAKKCPVGPIKSQTIKSKILKCVTTNQSQTISSERKAVHRN